LTPKRLKKQKEAILYIHGGTYVNSLRPYHWNFIKLVADKSDVSFIVPDYPLAPESCYRETIFMMEKLIK